MVNAQEWLDKEYPINRRNEITELDISKGKVKKLFVHNSTLKGDLKLVGFTNLSKLRVSSHQLIKLDVSNCPNLEELDCHDNKLNNLNVNGCRYLSKINCSNNKLRELDLSTCTGLNEVDVNNCHNLTPEKIKTNLTHDTKLGKLLLKMETSISQTFTAKENDIRNILIIGITGNGKSALANTLSNVSEVNKFGEGNSSTSKTKGFQASNNFLWKGKNYRLVDNIGFGDTASLSKEDILFKIGEGICSAKEGINQVLFVINGRFAPEHIAAFKIFKDFIDGTGITKFTTIVKTHFTDFRSPEMCEEDKKALLSESKELKEIINSCNGIIHVDNPSIPLRDDKDSYNAQEIIISNEKRAISREIVLNHLAENCPEIYKLKNWDSIIQQVANCMPKIAKMEEERARSNNSAERDQLQSEIRGERRRVAEEVNVRLVAEIGVAPRLSVEAEFKNPNCCLIS